MSEEKSKYFCSEQDSAWKEVLDTHFKACMEFFYKELASKIDWSKGYESLDKELQAITSEKMVSKRFVDKLIKVFIKDKQAQTLFFHVEIQGQKDTNFEERLFQYYYRLYDKYKLPILTLAILTDSNKSWRPNTYRLVLWEHPIITFHFFTQKLLDFKAKEEDLFLVQNPFGMVVAAHLAAIETKQQYEKRLERKFTLTKLLYQKGLSRDAIITFFKMLDWLLVLPKELALQFKNKLHEYEEEKKMSYITSIEQISREEGREEGEHCKAIAIAKNLLAEGMSPKAVQKLTGLLEKEVMDLLDKH